MRSLVSIENSRRNTSASSGCAAVDAATFHASSSAITSTSSGIVEIARDGDKRYGLVIAHESHNHPSQVVPYEGAATGVGGILRDVFTMGARPIALLDSLRFGGLDTAKNRHIVKGVVAGIAGYGNCMGVPTVGDLARFPAAVLEAVFGAAGRRLADRLFHADALPVGFEEVGQNHRQRRTRARAQDAPPAKIESVARALATLLFRRRLQRGVRG